MIELNVIWADSPVQQVNILLFGEDFMINYVLLLYFCWVVKTKWWKCVKIILSRRMRTEWVRCKLCGMKVKINILMRTQCNCTPDLQTPKPGYVIMYHNYQHWKTRCPVPATDCENVRWEYAARCTLLTSYLPRKCHKYVYLTCIYIVPRKLKLWRSTFDMLS